MYPALVVCHGPQGRKWFARAPMVPRHWFPQEQLHAESGAEVEIVDLLTISPLDRETLAASVRKTGRAVIVHETFNADQAWVAEHRDLYANGKVGDVVVKKKLVEVLDALIEPIRTRRKQYENRPDDVIDVLREGTKRANTVAEETLALAKAAMKQDYFQRELRIS